MMFAIALFALAVVRPPVATLADGLICLPSTLAISRTFSPGITTALFLRNSTGGSDTPTIPVIGSPSNWPAPVLSLSLVQPSFEGLTPSSLTWRVYNETGFALFNSNSHGDSEMFAQDVSVCLPGIYDCNVTLPSAGSYFSTLTSVLQSERSVSAGVQCQY